MVSRASQWRRLNLDLLNLLNEAQDTVETDDSLENQELENLESPNDILHSPANESVDENDPIFDPEFNSEPSSSSDSEISLDGAVDAEAAFLPELAAWAIRQNISHVAINGLMRILHNHINQELPVDARTLLKTPRDNGGLIEKCGGEYVYFGIKSGLQSQSLKTTKVSLIVNVDGLPLFKSCDTEVWPILGSNNGGIPFIISLWCGSGKPNSSAEFLNDFLVEYDKLKNDGDEISGTNVQFEIKCFSCDAPARQFLKQTKEHTGYYACERCQVKGEMTCHTMTFEQTDSTSRNDVDFNACNYNDHQHGKSALIDHGIPCVRNFVLDYMHLVCLGVVKRMLYFLSGGPRICKLSQNLLDVISTRLFNLRNKLPSEFARQPRSLKYLKRWKATEFKQFLLYTGMSVLKGVVSKDIYEHFLCLSVSISVLLYYKPEDEAYMQLFKFTKEHFLSWYVDSAPFLYGNTFVSYNVHNLIHLPDDVETHSAGLEHLSAFRFENFLHRIKKMVRKSTQPLSQIIKRVSEMQERDHEMTTKVLKTKIKVSKKTNNRNSWFLLKNNRICEIIKVERDGQMKAKLFSFKNCKSYFSTPLDSKLLKICFLPKSSKFKKVDNITKADIFRKFLPIPETSGILLVPMLHEIQF